MDNSIEEIKRIDLVEYLKKLGHEPAKVKGNDYWYICPFQGERTASFKVNRRINRWYHFALGKGGSIIDFGILYFQCSISEFLKKFDDLEQRANSPMLLKNDLKAEPENPVILRTVRDLKSPSLLSYLQQRGISETVSKRFCRQVNFSIGDKRYYAVGFGNQKGGYELRSKFMKVAASPKAVTLISNLATNLKVVEGFIDFLSLVEYLPDEDFERHDYLILNSTAFLELALEISGSYKTGIHYFDNDATGQKCRLRFAQERPNFADGSKLYDGFNDFNDWWETRQK